MDWEEALLNTDKLDKQFTTDIQFIKDNGNITYREVIARELENKARSIVFIEKGVCLLSTNGSMAFIIPNTLLVNENANIVRKELVAKSLLSTVRIYSEQYLMLQLKV